MFIKRGPEFQCLKEWGRKTKINMFERIGPEFQCLEK